jgi:hypothetical protein
MKEKWGFNQYQTVGAALGVVDGIYANRLIHRAGPAVETRITRVSLSVTISISRLFPLSCAAFALLSSLLVSQIC